MPLRLVSSGDARRDQRLSRIPWLGRELVVADRDGRVWAGPAAFLVCFWALRRYRIVARLSLLCLPLSVLVLSWISGHRAFLSRALFGERCEGGHCGVPASRVARGSPRTRR